LVTYDAKKWRRALRRGRAGHAARVGLRVPPDVATGIPADLVQSPAVARTAG
jgi:hypothetical protein